MSKKGFTLVEIIAVLTIMTILLAITLPSIFNSLDRRKRTSHNNIVDEIKNAAILYITQNKEVKDYISSNNEINISYDTLVKEGLVKGTQTDPLTSEPWNKNSYVKATYNNTTMAISTDYIESPLEHTYTLESRDIEISSSNMHLSDELLKQVTAVDETGRNYINAVTYSCQINQTGPYSPQNCLSIKTKIGTHNIRYNLLNQTSTSKLVIY